MRASVVGLLAVLGLLASFSVLSQSRIAQRSQRADRYTQLSEAFQAARFWVSQEESLERKYRLETLPEVLVLHQQSERRVVEQLRRLPLIDRSPRTRAASARLLLLHREYVRVSGDLLRAVQAHDATLVLRLDHLSVDPVFGELQQLVDQRAAAASRRALAENAALRRDEGSATKATAIAFALGLALLLGFGLIIARDRGRLDAARRAELKRLAEIAITDPLTGLRNHRAFHEDLERSLHRVSRTGVPMSLVMLDLDRLKQVNDSLGHQAGDERLQALAGALDVTRRGSDCAYRIGGDEFAVILDDVRAWNALEFVQRLQDTLSVGAPDARVSVSAGISEALALAPKDTVIREAGLALLATRRSGQAIGIYSTDMEPDSTGEAAEDDEHHTRTLAHALALAVDAKDSYTRSHSQTVAQLSVVIAAELNLDDERLARIRIAGLLHDVGKIGIPDAILNKPARLSPGEFLEMQGHALLGYDIISAADLPTEALWVRHHHERYDGHGYPDRLSGEDIPLEARIIGVADAYEAMTSDRPYRKAPGQQYAIGELRRHAGTQFDPGVADALCRALERLRSGAPAGLLTSVAD